MLLKLLVICGGLAVIHCQKEHRDWDIAVVISDQIELLQSNGTLIGATVEQFTKLKALTFDNVRHQFVVSNNNQSNDTIFTVELTKETEITPIIPNLPDVLGLAVDPIEDVLYWTDSTNKAINYAKLNSSVLEPKLLFDFSDATPQDIAIDVCRRQIYWTNSDPNYPTIERAFLNGSNREVLIESGLNLPIGIAIDYKAQRLIWADRGEGIYYRIDSSDLDGNNRQLIYNGTDIKPFGIAVDDLSVYWTDIVNNALWRFYKSDKEGVEAKPETIRMFKGQPMGVIAKNAQIRNYPDCKELEVAIENYRGESKEIFDTTDPEEVKDIECLNGGQLNGKYCKCTPGYSGRYCEQNKCHNFCVHGACYFSGSGYPQCSCPRGFGGERCQLDMCSTYCLNNGLCSYYKGDLLPSCQCTQHFTGSRCEISTDFHSLCGLYCRESTNVNDYLVSKDRELVCRCENENGKFVISQNNVTVPALYSESSPLRGQSFFEKFTTDSEYTTLVLVCCLCVVLNVILFVYLFASRPNKRPIIKRRVIVNKNVTPLTYRPQPTTEQCEITMIENCCNMNVCETPCFEPSAFRKNKEDKKVLLSDMENGEDTY
ncbi:protein cueball [Anthonomus grandis grandis]|uniref:protein cueball n=1 Tax=Anthonomus grandis grandis TaxID=2921223 RepID=UPI002165CD84|nr:protein cueball [Anthonomus grandis grandis]